MRSLWIPGFILLGLVAFTGYELYHSRTQRGDTLLAHTQRQPVLAQPAATASHKPYFQTFAEKTVDFALPPSTPENSKSDQPPPLAKDLLAKFVSSPSHMTLFHPRAVAAVKPLAIPPTYYLPSHRLIRCRLVSGVTTGKIKSPIIAFVLEDQCNIDADGITRVVIPAGVEIHGLSAPAPVRDRVNGEGTWTFVWRTDDANNSMELTVHATALTRDYNEETKIYGDQEKSPGLIGIRFADASTAVIQSALLKALGAVPAGIEQYTQMLNSLTSTIVSAPKPTIGNALLGSSSAGLEDLGSSVEGIRKQIEENGFYVVVLPGKEFYLYCDQPIDLRRATRPHPIIPGEEDKHPDNPLAELTGASNPLAAATKGLTGGHKAPAVTAADQDQDQ